jgi:hypothetical protein
MEQGRSIPPLEEGRNETFLKPPFGRLPFRVRGRDKIIDELTALTADPYGKIQVITGMGGVGKSTVALSVANQLHRSGCSVWWISATSASSVLSDLLSLATQLGAPLMDVRNALSGQADPSDVLWSCLSRRSGWLIVLDNVDDVLDLTTTSRSTRDGNGWLRGSPNGRVLVTSRNADPQSWGAHCRIHHLEPLGDDAGAALLLDLAPDAGTTNPARRISSQLGGLPLALEQAGHYIALPFVEERTFEQYLANLPSALADLRPAFAPTRDARDMVTATWDISLRALERQGVTDVRELMTVLAFFATPSPIPLPVLHRSTREGVLSPSTLSVTLPALRSNGLIATPDAALGPTDAPFLITVHPVVAQAFRHNTPDDIEPSMVQTVINCLTCGVSALDRADPTTWPIWRMLVPHIVELLNYDNPERIGIASLNELIHVCARTVSALAISSDHPYAEEITRPLTRYTQVFPEHHIVNITASYTIAYHRRTSSFSTEGELEFRRILGLQQHILGGNHFDTLHTRHNLAHTLAANGQIDEAIREFQETIYLREQTLGRLHYLTLASRQALVYYLIESGRTGEARRELDTIQEATSGAHHRGDRFLLTLRYSLAKIRLLEGDTAGLMTELQEILARQIIVLGGKHISTDQTRETIADLHELEGRPHQSLDLLEAVLREQQGHLGADHAFTLRTARKVETLSSRLRSTPPQP